MANMPYSKDPFSGRYPDHINKPQEITIQSLFPQFNRWAIGQKTINSPQANSRHFCAHA